MKNAVAVSILIAVSFAAINVMALTNGQRAEPNYGQAKKMVMLYVRTPDDLVAFCTATLISRRHLLTSAQCAANAKNIWAVFSAKAVENVSKPNFRNDPNIISVVNRKYPLGWAGGLTHYFAGMGGDENDISILLLEKEAPSFAVVTKIAPDWFSAGGSLTAVGFGKTTSSGLSGYLNLEGTTMVRFQGEHEFIVGPSGDERKNCFDASSSAGDLLEDGDGGSAAFIKSTDNDFYQLGVASRTESVCSLRAIYTYLPHYANWINSTISSFH